MTEQCKVMWNIVRKDGWYALMETFTYGKYYDSNIVCECRCEEFLLDVIIPQRQKEYENAVRLIVGKDVEECEVIDDYFQHRIQNWMNKKKVYLFPQLWEDK